MSKTARQILEKWIGHKDAATRYSILQPSIVSAMEEYAAKKEIKMPSEEEIKFPTEDDANKFAELRGSCFKKTAESRLALTESFNGYMVAIERIKQLNGL